MTEPIFIPDIDAIEVARRRMGDMILETPTWQWQGDWIQSVLGPGTEVFLKLELFQYTGTFKPRGALLNIQTLSEDALARGVTAVSAGNHAAAVAYAAKKKNTQAKVVMPKYANPVRIAICRSYDAEIVIVDDIHMAFEKVKQIEKEEGRTFIHPFEGYQVALGTATVGLEFCQQVPDLDVVIIPVGGGGLCAGIAAAVKQIQPRCLIYAVEPYGADSLYRSFQSGKPEALRKVDTIADSLAAPHAAEYSFQVCKRFIDELVRVDDDALCESLYYLFSHMKLAVEPAGAAATAAMLGPLKVKLSGKRVGLIICGANIDPDGFSRYLRRGAEKAMLR